MIKDYKNQTLFYLIFLLPFTFVIGIAITEIIVFSLTLYFIFKNKNFKYFKNKKILFLLVFSIYIALHAYINIHDNLRISSIFHFRYLLFSISIICILEMLNTEKKINFEKFFFLISIILLLIFFDTLYQFFKGENLLGNKVIRNRISGIFGSEFILGSFLMKFLPVYLWLLYYMNLDLKKFSKLIIFALSGIFICIYISGERTSFALLLFLIFCFIIFLKNLRNILIISSTIFLIFISITLFTDIGKSDLFNRIFVKSFNQMTGQVFTINEEQSSKIDIKDNTNKIIKNLKFFSEDHQGHFVLAYKLFLNKPVFGLGPRGFRYHCRNIEYDSDVGICSTHPHNIVLQFLSEVGIVGFVFYLFIIFYLLLKVVKVNIKLNQNSEKYCFLISSIGILAYLFPFLPSGNFFNNWISINNYYLFALYYYSYNKVFNKA